MIITFKNYHNIKFPVYILPSDNWQYIDGLLFIDDMLVDDRNMPGKTLGARRLQTSHPNKAELKKSIVDFARLIRYGGGTYIDSNGKIFTYEKTKYCALKYYRIVKIEKKILASLLWLKGINFPITIERPPHELFTYAGMLHYENLPWLLYDFSSKKCKSTRKLV